MYKFYCPVCDNKNADADFNHTSQAISLPHFSDSKEDKGYALHFICCKKCDTVLSTVAVPIEPWTK